VATLTVYAGTADSSVRSSATSWTDARAGTGTATLSVRDTGNDMTVGITNADSDEIQEGFLGFDTSAIGQTNSVISATLALYLMTTKTGAWNVEARAKDWSTTVDTGDWVAGADWTGNALLATLSTYGSLNYASFTSQAAFAGAVNRGGTTGIVLCSETIASATNPAAIQSLQFRTADQSGTTNDPKLTVEYQFAGTAIMHGVNF
jgi:hypothetical protein